MLLSRPTSPFDAGLRMPFPEKSAELRSSLVSIVAEDNADSRHSGRGHIEAPTGALHREGASHMRTTQSRHKTLLQRSLRQSYSAMVSLAYLSVLTARRLEAADSGPSFPLAEYFHDIGSAMHSRSNSEMTSRSTSSPSFSDKSTHMRLGAPSSIRTTRSRRNQRGIERKWLPLILRISGGSSAHGAVAARSGSGYERKG